MSVTQTIHVSVDQYKLPAAVHAVQNDSGRIIKMVVDDLTLTSSMTGKLSFRRPSGTYYELAATLDLASNSFSAEMDQALTSPGTTHCQLKVTSSGDLVSSFDFDIFVEEDRSGVVTPEEGISISEAVASAEAAADRAESAASTFETDTTLSVAGMAADAKTVGDDLDALDGRLDAIEDDYVTESEMTAAISANVDATLSVSGKAADAKAAGDRLHAIEDDYVPMHEIEPIKRNNLFDKTAAQIVSIMCNSSLVFITGGGVQSTIWKCKPNTKYTVSWNRITGNSRFIVYLSTSYPVVDTVSAANSLVNIDTTISGSTRQYKTFTTGANDNYMLLYFWVNSTGGEATLNDIQISEGDQLLDYTSYSQFTLPNLAIIPDNTGSAFSVDVFNMSESMANLLSYRPLGALSKGAICLVADDGTADIADVSWSVSANKNVPITFALWTESACVTDQTMLSELSNMISNYGCSVCQHGAGNFTDYDPKTLMQYLASEKAAWADFNIPVKGLAYPNHARNNMVRAICGSMYDVCCSGGASRPIVYDYDLSGARSNIFDLYRVSLYSSTENALTQSCTYAKQNNKILLIFYHDNDIVGVSEQLSKLNNVIDFAKGINLDFITVGDIPNFV